ncbi:MAG: AEC family transporter [Pseudomonadota bacterium]
MSDLLTLLNTATLPIFAVSAVGFWLARRGMFTQAQAEGVNAFAMKVAVPALIFGLLSRADLEGYDWRVMGLYALAEVTVYGATYLVCRYGFGLMRREALLLGMASIFVNGVFFVLPIAGLLYGPAAEEVIVGLVVIDSTLLFGGTILIMDILAKREGGLVKLATTFATNPVIVAMVLGVGVSLAGLAVPPGLETYVSFVGAAASPAALFALGVILSDVRWAEVGGSVPAVIAMKMIAQPLVTFGLMVWLAAPSLWSETAVLFTAGPAGAMPFVIALSYGIRTDRIAIVVIVTTLLSLVTLPGAALLGG